MPIQRKLGVVGIFLLGGLVTMTGIVRLYYIQQIYTFHSQQTDTGTCKSPLRSSTHSRSNEGLIVASGKKDPVMYWSVIEVNVGVLSACLPTMRPLYRGYHLNLVVSKISNPFRDQRSTASDQEGIHLTSLEHGLVKHAGKNPCVHANDSFSNCESLDISAPKPAVMCTPYGRADGSLHRPEGGHESYSYRT